VFKEISAFIASSDMPLTPKEILVRFFDAERTYVSTDPADADPTLFTATLAPDVKLIQSPDLPYGGTYEGIEGFLDWGKQMNAIFSKADVEDPEVLEGENKVVVLSTVHFTVRRTGESFSRPLVQVAKVDTDKGVITEMRPVYWDVGGIKKNCRGI
jgi:uncharacterized protein